MDVRCQFATGTAREPIMATTMEQAVYPLLMTASVLGLGVHSPRKVHLSILYNLTVWIAFGCLFYYIVTALKADPWFRSPFSLINLHIGVLTSITSIILSVYQDKRFRIFIKRLEAIDNTLEELGTPKTYQKLRTCTKRVLIGWFVYSHSGNACDMIWWWNVMKDWRCMIIPYITNHFYNFNMFVDFLFGTFMWYIGTRFDKVNEHMRYLLMKEEHGLRCIWKKTIPITRRYITRADNYKRVLWTSMHLHLELCQIARELNVMYGTQMTMEVVAHLIYITRMTTIFLIHLLSKNRYMFTAYSWVNLQFWILTFVIRLVGINCICENISAKANEMEKIIHQLTNFLQYADVQDEIHQFILQIIHHPLKFTGLSLFYFGNSFLLNFFERVATFVMILVQMSNILPPYTYEKWERGFSK